MLPITKRLPCSVCGFDSFSRRGWFLVVENRWLDRLKIFTWHPSLASQKNSQSVCGRQHLKVLIAYWLEQANLRFLSFAEEPSPNPNDPCSGKGDFESGIGPKLVGELSVYREGYSHAWAGSRATVESILDALMPAEAEEEHETADFPVFQSASKPPHELSLH